MAPPRPTAAGLALPRLPFGERSAVTDHNLNHYADQMAAVLPGLDVAVRGDKAEFAYKSHTQVIHGLHLVASANTPLYVGVDGVQHATLLIPFYGESESVQRDGVRSGWAGGQRGAFFPPGASGGTTTGMRSTLTLNLDLNRLQTIASQMLGASPARQGVDLQLLKPRTLELNPSGVSLGLAFQNLCSLIDLWQQQPQVLAHMGIDDLMYRHVAVLLRPELFLALARNTPEKHERKPSSKAITLLCDWLTAHLGERITMSDMEKMTGLSERSLQYAFLGKYGCTPMQWLKSERLAWARRLLQGAQPGTTVTTITTISHLCGFADPSAFALAYRRKYGELPSVTLGNKA
jgi:AraC-like DNA-binding protein